MKAGETGLTQKLEKFSRKGGADLFGVADLGLAVDFIASQCPSWVGAFPRAVSLGMQVNAGIAEQHDPNEPRHLSMYWFHVYEVVSPALNFLAYDTARWLTAKGFKAFPIPASMPYDPGKAHGRLLPQARRPPRRPGMDRKELSSPHRPVRPPGPLCLRAHRRSPGNGLPPGPALRKMPRLRRRLPGESVHRSRISPGRAARGPVRRFQMQRIP